MLFLKHRNIKSTLFFIIFVSVILRAAGSLYLGNQVEVLPGTFDQTSYHSLAVQLIKGNGFTFPAPSWPALDPGEPTAHWSYLYTFYLTAVYALFGINPLAARLIQSVIVGILHPLLVFLIARRVSNSSIGLAASGLTAVYTYFIYYAATLMTEAFFITAVLASIYLSLLLVGRWQKQNQGQSNTHNKQLSPQGDILLALFLGLTLAAAILLRQLFMIFIPLLFLWIWWYGNRRRAVVLAISALVIVASILPFTYYNYLRFDRFILLNTNAGYAFFFANHPTYGTRFESILAPGEYYALIPADLRELDEAALEQALLKRGLQFVVDDPIRYLQLSVSRIPSFFKFWPSPESGFISNLSRVTSFGIMWPFMLAGMGAAFVSARRSNLRYKNQDLLLLVGFMAFYTLIHILSWALIRYRLPVDAVLLIFAGYAIVELFKRLPLKKPAPAALNPSAPEKQSIP
jgi:4-amino-4-deoxy-L-arabinose transferase-like glycosyltransferase